MAAALHRRVHLSSDDGADVPDIVDITQQEYNPGYDYNAPAATRPFSGGHAYVLGRQNLRTRHRVLYWHSTGNVLELHERSLDLELTGSCARFRFKAPIFSTIVAEEIEADNHHPPILQLNFVLCDGTLFRLGFVHPASQQLPPNRVPGGLYASVLASAPNVYNYIAGGRIPISVSGAGDTLVVASEDGALFAHYLPIINGLHRGEGYDAVELNTQGQLGRIIGVLTPNFMKPRSAADRVTGLCSLVHDGRWSTTFTLTAGLELKAHRLHRGNERDTQALTVLSLRDYIADPAIHAMNLQSDRHALRVCDRSAVVRGTSYIAAYVASTMQSVVMIFECRWNIGEREPSVTHVGNKLGIPGTLIDFHVTVDQIWFLVDSGGYPAVYHSPIPGDAGAPSQLKAVEPSLSASDALALPIDRSVREVYAAYIFRSKLFSISVIIEATSVYAGQRVVYGSLDELQNAATVAVENKIRARAMGVEVDRRELEIRCWYELLQSCLHFWIQENAVQGIFRDQTTGFSYVVKTRGLEVIRRSSPVGAAEATADPDVARLLGCMDLASDLFGSEIDKQMFGHPHRYCSDRASEVLLNDVVGGDVGAEFAAKVAGIVELPAAVQAVLRQLEPPAEMALNMAGHRNFEDRVDLFSSHHGVTMLADGILDYVTARLQRARNLLLTLALAFRLRLQADVKPEVRAALAQDALPEACARFQELYILHWVATTRSSQVTDASIEASISHLRIIGGTYTPPPARVNSSLTILELFLSELDNLKELQESPVLDGVDNGSWGSVLDEMTMGALPLIRARDSDGRYSPNVTFCKFLLARCQLEQLQEYILLLGRDCASSSFMLAQIQLRNGEMHKSKANFVRAVSAVEPMHDEAPIFRRLVGLVDEPGQTGRLSKSAYYVKIMEFFKESIPRSLNALDEVSKPGTFGRLHAPLIVVSFARAALRSIGGDVADDPHALSMVSMLWATIFQYGLDLGDNDSAYAAAMANPDPDIRGDCLQRLIGVLCERGHTQAVVEFAYIGAQDQVLDIIKTKTKNLDMLSVYFDEAQTQRSVNYYRVLYAFLIHRADFHSAGMAMFECASRLELEYQFLYSDGAGRDRCVQMLGHQRDAMLTAMNTLELVDSDHAWFVRRREASKKRRRDGPVDPMLGLMSTDATSADVDVLGLQELEQEYTIILARLDLLEDDGSDAGRILGKGFSEVDAIEMLRDRGSFDLAFTIAKLFRDQLDAAVVSQVFTALADKCARLTIDPSVEHGWLLANDVNLGPAMPPALGDADPLDQQNTSSHPADKGWEFLRLLLRLYDSTPANNFQHHIDVADRVMSLRFDRDDSGDSYVPLPKWLLGSLMKRNRPALLRLYIEHSDLDSATALALNMIKDAAPRTTDDRGAFRRWLPYSELDALVAKLETRERREGGSAAGRKCGARARQLREETRAYHDDLGQGLGPSHGDDYGLR